MRYKRGDVVQASLNLREYRGYGSRNVKTIESELGTIVSIDGLEYYIKYANGLHIHRKEEFVSIPRKEKLALI